MASDENASLGIAIDGERWTATRSLADSGPESRVFTVRVTADGGTVVTFGDGIHGKALPDGARIVLTLSVETPVPVSLHRSASPSTPDQPLWTVVRRRTDGTELEFYAPCLPTAGEGALGPDASRRIAHWRRVALLLGAALLALAVWCVST